MKLKGIKLSGFKSFVDSTAVTFPSSMTCIVGPNGCGKSNVIDAVRWVLGESSAKNLRSDSMSDVVFNGSSSRKPVSRATVELLFDNSDGRIGGEYSGYNEISVRRSLEMDGQSNYYLNGTSCRKRDITDVFLGTGLGPRSYAIIEQGMISQLVSAKPDEMRSYIEEVAGVSRYLERKRETESSIRKTRENLSRLEDLREEIGRLLFKLQQQAKSAEKYKQYRKDENYFKGLLLASKWKDVSRVTALKDASVKDQELKLEEANASKTNSDSEVISLRAKQIELQTELDKVQQEFYSCGADISRAEQELRVKKVRLNEQEEKLRNDSTQLQSKLTELKNLEEDKLETEASISLIAPELEELRNNSQPDNSASKTNSDSEVISLRAKQIELQTELDKVQQEFYSCGADISRAEQELRVKKVRLNEQEEKLRNDSTQLQSKLTELKNLEEDKLETEASISLIAPELEELRNKKSEEGHSSSSKDIETEWLLFITESEKILNEIEKIAQSITKGLDNELLQVERQNILNEIEVLKTSIKDLSNEPARLTKKTQEVLTSSVEIIKNERINILDKTERYANLQAKLATISSQDGYLNSRIEELKAQIEVGEKEILQAKEPIGTMQTDLEKLLEVRLKVETKLLSARKSIDDCSDSINTMEGKRLEKEQGERIDLLDKTERYANLQAKLATISSQDGYLNSRIEELKAQIEVGEKEILQAKEPIGTMQTDLEKLLEVRLKVETKLLSARKSIDDCSDSINKFERMKAEKELLINKAREELEESRLQRQASKLESENIEKLLIENDNDLAKLLEELDEEKTTQSLENELEAIEKKIYRLGAINLAAMEESEQEEKRKSLLDAQHEELTEALDILQEAIGKIDRETRTTFKDTFDKLNLSLAKSFPKLFGGGHAELTILGDDLLTAGVGITAQPPGKKNASVSQLSGGEKALTAIAIVFAFFELNPAPFCMLDEVDAPLDDLNTMRFIDLVQEMSEKVQFIYITHNKISMEKSKHLMGVTMQEPGVSRMVAVDVEEAVELAAS